MAGLGLRISWTGWLAFQRAQSDEAKGLDVRPSKQLVPNDPHHQSCRWWNRWDSDAGSPYLLLFRCRERSRSDKVCVSRPFIYVGVPI